MSVLVLNNNTTKEKKRATKHWSLGKQRLCGTVTKYYTHKTHIFEMKKKIVKHMHIRAFTFRNRIQIRAYNNIIIRWDAYCRIFRLFPWVFDNLFEYFSHTYTYFLFASILFYIFYLSFYGFILYLTRSFVFIIR